MNLALKEAKRESFKTTLQRSIREGIAAVVGKQTAIAVEFYVDSSLAAKDIVAYTKALENMFTIKAPLLEKRCAGKKWFKTGGCKKDRQAYQRFRHEGTGIN